MSAETMASVSGIFTVKLTPTPGTERTSMVPPIWSIFVRTNIDQIGGTIDVRSVPGVGVSFTVKIPLTLAIVSALIVEAGGDRYAIPQLAVIELVRAHGGSEHRIERIKDTAVLRLRDKLLPVARLSR